MDAREWRLSTKLLVAPRSQYSKIKSECWLLVAIAGRNHPVPFRTRSLSLPTLMVLHEGSCGRVRRCRNTYTVPSPQGGRSMRVWVYHRQNSLICYLYVTLRALRGEVLSIVVSLTSNRRADNFVETDLRTVAADAEQAIRLHLMTIIFLMLRN